MRFEADFGARQSGARRKAQGPLRLVVIADVMGNRAAEAQPVGQRPIVSLSVDTFDDVFAQCRPSVAVPALGLNEPIAFNAIDDFHPDRLFERLPVFNQLRSVRQRLLNPSTFAAAAAELKSDAVTPEHVGVSPPGSEETPDALLERLLGTTSRPLPPAQDTRLTGAHLSIDAYIHSLVAPYITPAADPQQAQFLLAVDAAIADTMRALLHDSAFQRLEATWRGIRWLATTIDNRDEADLEIGLLQLTRQELSAHVQPDGALAGSLEPRSTHELPWSLVVADFIFGPSSEDIEMLRALATVMGRCDTLMVAAAQAALVGCVDLDRVADPRTWSGPRGDIARLWADLRAATDAQFICLTWPRIILRLPYGQKTDPIDAFGFEELPATHAHEDYLWGNGAFAVALAMAWVHAGQSGALAGDIADLPAFTYLEDGEPTMKPCAEIVLSERAADEALARGFTPLVSYRHRNAVRLIRLQSIAKAAFS